MKEAGHIALMPFPFTDFSYSKRRPVFLVRKLDQGWDDWLVCMISSQLHQCHEELDWVVQEIDQEFPETGLKTASVFRLSRLAVIDGGLLLGRLGHVTDQRLNELRKRLSCWLVQGGNEPPR